MAAASDIVSPPRSALPPRRHPFIAGLLRLVREKPLGAIGLAIVLVFLICGIFADVIAPYGINQISPVNRLKPPSARFWFGTDHLGRDMFSRILFGAQLSVIIGLSAASLATVISLTLGIVSGYFGGKIDMLLQRLVDAWMSFPELIILIVVVSVVPIVLELIAAKREQQEEGRK